MAEVLSRESAAALQLRDLHARLDALFLQQHHEVGAEWHLEGSNPSDDDRLGTYYAAGNDLREDRADAHEAERLAALTARLDALQRDQHRDRVRERGMEY
jgi:hypothetical protein